MDLKLSADEQKTVATYNKNASNWASKHSTARFWGDEMDKFSEYLPSGKILEIGAGGGRDAKELIELGYDYTGIDVSEGLLNEAKKINPKADFKLMSLYEMEFPNNSFDGFWCSATLLHIPKDKIDEALKNIHKVVKPNGIGFITIKKGEGEKIEVDEPQIKGDRSRLFAYYQNEEFKAVLNRNKFEVISYDTKPMSERTIWLIYFVRVKK